MGFSTKKELLEYLGKNGNDNKLVDRLILRGEVCLVDGVYEIVDKDAIIADLQRKVSELEGKLTLSQHSNGDLEEAKAQWEYWEKEAREYAQYCADVVDICYRKVKAVMGSRFTEDRETFKEGIQRMVKGEE